jgi:hypothetical protein
MGIVLEVVLSEVWRASFIIFPNMTALVHRQPVSAGIFHNSCFAEDNDKCDFYIFHIQDHLGVGCAPSTDSCHYVTDLL